MNHQFVDLNRLNPIFPACIPQKRSNRDKLDKAIIATTFLGVSCAFAPESPVDFLLTSAVYNSLLLITAEFCSRVSYLREEYMHLESRYKNSVWNLVEGIFSFNKKTLSAIVGISTIGVLRHKNIFENVTLKTVIGFTVSFQGIKLLTDLLDMNESRTNTAKIIERCFPLDWPTGMAFSYFYGYLEFMLPPSGEESKGLKEQILDFSSANEGLTFASYKLFILLPLSAKCPHNLENYSPLDILKRCDNLDWKKKDVAGVKDREYHNTVYKLYYRPNQPVHVCAEFASPLKTFYNTIEHNHAESVICKEYQREFVVKFFYALQKIINDKGYNNYCELILFEDMDENGRYIYEDRLDIGDLLLRKINNPKYLPLH